MEFFKKRDVFIVSTAIAVLTAGVFFILAIKIFFATQTKTALENQNNALAPIASDVPLLPPSPSPLPSPIAPLPPLPPPAKLKNPPEIIKAVYITGWSAGSQSYLNYLTNLFETTEINAVVIDIKDYSGLVSYASGAPDAVKYNLYSYAISDIDSLVRFFHDKNIYVIGRISVFEDPAYAKARPELAIYDKEKDKEKTEDFQLNNSMELFNTLWKDNKGLLWLDPASKEVWDYNISIAEDAFYHGFDEINFDYVRFPSDGKTENMGFPVWDEKNSMSEVIKEFFLYLRNELEGKKISVDLFGQTTINRDDMGIGQILEDAFEYFDYISPMIYPSHYASGFAGFVNPAEHPYEVVKYSLDSAVLRENDFFGLSSVTESNNKIFKFRPWLQDFDLGADYTAEMVKQEIQATQDALGTDYKGFMLWSPSNIYTQGAILKFE